MLPRADIITVNPVGHAETVTRTAALGDARQEAFQRSLAGLLKGEVLSRLTDGTFLVKVAGTSARLNLPPGADVGHEVPLTLVALAPRPTFEIHVAEQGGRAATLAYAEAGPALAQQAPSTPAAAVA
ncbi:MAG: flagellar hook-length control protein FliK, partial [Pseudomonadota bacterium]